MANRKPGDGAAFLRSRIAGGSGYFTKHGGAVGWAGCDSHAEVRKQNPEAGRAVQLKSRGAIYQLPEVRMTMRGFLWILNGGLNLPLAQHQVQRNSRQRRQS